MRKLKWRTDKFKGTLPSRCFNFGKASHFSSICPYKKGFKSDDEEETHKKEKIHDKRNKGNFQKNKTLYLKEDNSSFDEDDSDNDPRRALFIAL